jgi:twitching motility two-component system response regulator PilH
VGETLHVVIADPDAGERERISRLVADVASEHEKDVEIHEAEDGKRAKELIEEHPPCLVLCEILLEHVSGLALIRQMKGRGSGKKTPPVILVTSMTHASDRYWGLRVGAHAYIMKPYEEGLLQERIVDVLASGPAAQPERITIMP